MKHHSLKRGKTVIKRTSKEMTSGTLEKNLIYFPGWLVALSTEELLQIV